MKKNRFFAIRVFNDGTENIFFVLNFDFYYFSPILFFILSTFMSNPLVHDQNFSRVQVFD